MPETSRKVSVGMCVLLLGRISEKLVLKWGRIVVIQFHGRGQHSFLGNSRLLCKWFRIVKTSSLVFLFMQSFVLSSASLSGGNLVDGSLPAWHGELEAASLVFGALGIHSDANASLWRCPGFGFAQVHYSLNSSNCNSTSHSLSVQAWHSTSFALRAARLEMSSKIWQLQACQAEG